MRIKGVLIDIDDTLICGKKLYDCGAPKGFFNLLHNAGVQNGKLSSSECNERIEIIRTNMRWWSWSHFIEALELDEEAFWKYAYEEEVKYLEPTEPGLCENLKRLKAKGLNLYITSNNPNIGIKHKLRIAGVDDETQHALFTKLLGATELQAMKDSTAYWEQALNMTLESADELAVIGDSINDDFLTPHKVGIKCTFWLNRKNEENFPKSTSIIPVINFNEINHKIGDLINE